KAYVGSIRSEKTGRYGRESGLELRAGIDHCCAIQISAGRSGTGGCVGNLVSARRHDADCAFRKAETLSGNLANFGLQALAHLGAAMVNLHTAILIYKDKRSGLVEHSGGEGDPEFHRGDGNAALAMRMSCVRASDLLSSRGQMACLFQLVPDPGD